MRTPLYTGNQVGAIDKNEIALGTPGIELMLRAGRSAFKCILSLWPNCDELVIFCGAGNNAGDGYVIASFAHQASLFVRILYLKPPTQLKGDAALAANDALGLGVDCERFNPLLELSMKGQNTVLVDALLGTGFSGELSEPYETAIQQVNLSPHRIFSVDLPSGVYADTGSTASCAVRANATMSFIGRKRGVYTGDGKAHAGALYFDDLGAQREAYKFEACVAKESASNKSAPNEGASAIPKCFLLEPENLLAKLVRDPNSHKGRHGHVAVVGGGAGSLGASIMSAEASVRSGAGLTSLYTGADGVAAAVSRLPEVMSTAVDDHSLVDQRFALASVFCIGPGMGLDESAITFANKAMQLQRSTVLDADALTLLARGEVHAPPRGISIITPHPGEAARLLQTSSSEIQRNRFDAVVELSRSYQCISVLKGAGTLISDGSTIWVCGAGNPGMAVGGMGDILAGVIAALLAQGLTPLEAAQLGVWAHSRAADILAEREGAIGLAATDLLPIVRKILNAKST